MGVKTHLSVSVFDHADISFNIAGKELKIAQIAQLSNQLFQIWYLVHIQLFRERLSEKMCTRQFRNVYDQYTVPDTVAFEPNLVTFLS